jgi:predicted ATP-grasp superfamily ATP-dependent carboligase
MSSPDPSPPLLVVGANARAAAHSALRAGFRPHGVNCLADVDFPGSSNRSARLPGDDRDARWLRALRASPEAPWLYTGGLENRPDLVSALAHIRPLLGNRGDRLRAVRNPAEVARALRAAGLPAPGVTLDPASPPRDGSWLEKPLASAGGRGIRPFTGAPADAAMPEPRYFQERIPGRSLSALYLADGSRSALMGASLQLHGCPGNEFAYRGSIGPVPVDPHLEHQLDAIGRVLTSRFGLLGIFGVDLIVRDGLAYTLEVNPRYTASVEVFELASRRSLLAEHVRLCHGEPLNVPGEKARFRGVVGKVVVYAPCACAIPRNPGARFRPRPDVGVAIGFYVPRHADIPWPGDRFERGQPVITLLDHAPMLAACLRRLEHRSALWHRRLSRPPWALMTPVSEKPAR